MAQIENQMTIPPELPEILRQFTKAAIQSQPSDLLEWTCLYFTALNDGTPLPIKERPERISLASWAVLTPQILKELHTKMAGRLTIGTKELISMWKELNLPEDLFKSIINVGCLPEEIEWLKFLALACSSLGVTIAKTLQIACNILSSDHGNEDPRIPFSTFQFLYTFLADIDGEVSESQVNWMLTFLREEVIGPDGLIKTTDFIKNPKVWLE